MAEDITAQVFAKLPQRVRQEIDAVPVIFEARPRDPNLDPELLGLFDPGPESAPAPRIILWLENIWNFAGNSLPDFRREVRLTLLHEIGHCLGWTEEDLEARGLG